MCVRDSDRAHRTHSIIIPVTILHLPGTGYSDYAKTPPLCTIVGGGDGGDGGEGGGVGSAFINMYFTYCSFKFMCAYSRAGLCVT